jgi:hypothetical protein
MTPSGTIPGQANTFVNGQATALLVASSNAPTETVTVTASLGVLVPPSYACLVAPYVPTAGFGVTPAAAGYYTPTTTVGNPNYVSGCGTASQIGTTGLATALNAAGGGLTGIVTLPNTTSASTTVNVGPLYGLQIAGASPTAPLGLTVGCNALIVTSYLVSPVANIAALVTPTNAVVSIWRFDNGSKQFEAGYFSDQNAPLDFSATNVGTTQTYYVCVNKTATIT